MIAMGGAAPTRAVRVPTPLGTVELRLPEGGALEPDPGVADGAMLVWAPAPGLGGFSISHGPAAGRRPEDLLALERGLADAVDVEEDGPEELRLRVETRGTRDAVQGPDGLRTGSSEMARRERVRFRFWESGGEAVRAGYRIDESAPGELREAFDRVTDSVRLVPG
jgi:hypothetical protein